MKKLSNRGFLVGGNPQSTVLAHNADATAHGVVALEPSPQIVRIGTPVHPSALTVAESGAPLAVSVPVVTCPRVTEIAGYKPVGITANGEIVLISTSDTSLLRISKDGFQTYREARCNIGFSSLWFDSAGNAYAASSRSVFRAAAGTWFFIKCFDFAAASGTAAQYSHTTDDSGGVFVSEYATSDADTGRQIWRSTDFGLTWASVNVDVGQRHFHGIYWHRSTNALYVFAGEPHAADADPSHGRKLLKSTDRGATWNTVFSFGDNADTSINALNPVGFADFGNHFLLGADGGSYGGFFLVDARNDTAAPRKINVRADNWSEATAGYIFQMAKDAAGNVIAPPEYSFTSGYKVVHPIVVVSALARPALAILSPYVTRQTFSTTIYGPDAAGNMAIISAANTTLLLPRISVKPHRGLCSSSNRGFVGNLLWDGSANIVPGVTIGGVGVVATGATYESSSNWLPVTAGKKYQLVSVVRRGAGVNDSLMREVRWFQDGTSLSNTQEVQRMAVVDVGAFTRIVSHAFTAPANANRMWGRFFNSKDTSNPHYIAARISVFESTNTEVSPGNGDLPWLPQGTASEAYAVARDGVLVDRIYSRGTPVIQSKDVDFPLLTSGDVEVGIVSKTSAAAGDYHHYIKVGGVRVHEAVGGLWASEIGNVTLLPYQSDQNQTLVARGISAPLIVALSANSVGIVNPETGAWSSYAASPGETATLVGTCVHVPLNVQNAGTFEDLARNYI